MMWLVQRGFCAQRLCFPSAASDVWLVRQAMAVVDMVVLSDVPVENDLERRA